MALTNFNIPTTGNRLYKFTVSFNQLNQFPLLKHKPTFSHYIPTYHVSAFVDKANVIYNVHLLLSLHHCTIIIPTFDEIYLTVTNGEVWTDLSGQSRAANNLYRINLKIEFKLRREPPSSWREKSNNDWCNRSFHLT